ncbi:MAG: hypothetical protein AB2L24_32075 [Mangrovibacterium sp.]
MGAIRPEIENTCLLDWRQAVHPLLMFTLAKEKRKVVPLDIRLTSGEAYSDDFRA